MSENRKLAQLMFKDNLCLVQLWQMRKSAGIFSKWQWAFQLRK